MFILDLLTKSPYNTLLQKFLQTDIAFFDQFIIIIIIITLFREDNIFGTDVSLIYGPQITNVDMLLKK